MMAAGGARAAASHTTRHSKMPDSKDDPKSSEWRPYMFTRDQWHCRICGDRFLYPEVVRKHIANVHNETMPPSGIRRNLAAKETPIILPSAPQMAGGLSGQPHVRYH